jgi:hypothetical protein
MFNTKESDRIDQRFAGLHNQALYAVGGDFNDTNESPWVNPLISSPHLTDVVGAHRPLDDRWTYYWKSRNKVSHIDYILASSAMANRVSNVVAQDPQKTPHIERQGTAFREISTVSGLVLPKESNLTFFEPDPVTVPVGPPTPSQKIDFRFPRYPEVIADWRANISDHCPVKIWF